MSEYRHHSHTEYFSVSDPSFIVVHLSGVELDPARWWQAIVGAESRNTWVKSSSQSQMGQKQSTTAAGTIRRFRPRGEPAPRPPESATQPATELESQLQSEQQDNSGAGSW